MSSPENRPDGRDEGELFAEGHQEAFNDAEANALAAVVAETYDTAIACERLILIGKGVDPVQANQRVVRPTKIKMDTFADRNGASHRFEINLVHYRQDESITATVKQEDTEEQGTFTVDMDEEGYYTSDITNIGRYEMSDMINILSSARKKYGHELDNLKNG